MSDDNVHIERLYADHMLMKLAARLAYNEDGELAQYLRDCIDQRGRLREVCEERDALLALLRDTVPQLTEIVRMPNAEFVADAHNAALNRLRAALEAHGSER